MTAQAQSAAWEASLRGYVRTSGGSLLLLIKVLFQKLDQVLQDEGTRSMTSAISHLTSVPLAPLPPFVIALNTLPL